MVESRLQGIVPHSGCSSGRQSVQQDDVLRLQHFEAELAKITAENRALKSQQQETRRLLDAAQQKNARLYMSFSSLF